MALAAVVMDRGSIRGFKEDAIAIDLVREIARLATRLPSSRHEQPGWLDVA